MTPGALFARGMANPLRASVMYPPDRSLFAPFRAAATPGSVAASLAAARSPIGLYVHVPFCETRCTYCDYATVPLAGHDAAARDAYVEGVVAELASVAEALPPGTRVAGLDVGGGTPGVLSARQLERILGAVASRFSLAEGFEVSTETTPTQAAADPAKWREVARVGVTRVSMGLQTAEPGLLRRVGRAPHGGDRPARGMEALRGAGFSLVNVDLMFALPGLTLPAWEATLEAAVALAPDVVTAYDTVYKNRRIAEEASRGAGAPSPEDFGAQYDRAFGLLTGAGFASRYGSVNFSRAPGRLGTSRYLEGRLRDGLDYVGVGLYASSLVGTSWRFGLARIDAWLAAARSGRLAAEDLYRLPPRHVEAKFLLLALTYGVLDAARFRARFGRTLEEALGERLLFLLEGGFLRPAPDGFELVPGRFRDLPGIRAALFPDDATPLLDLPVVSPLRAVALGA